MVELEIGEVFRTDQFNGNHYIVVSKELIVGFISYEACLLRDYVEGRKSIVFRFGGMLLEENKITRLGNIKNKDAEFLLTLFGKWVIL